MYCGYCGKEYRDPVKFCPHCGAKVGGPAGTVTGQYPDGNRFDYGNCQTDVKKKRSKTTTVCVAIIALASIAVTIALAMPSFTDINVPGASSEPAPAAYSVDWRHSPDEKAVFEDPEFEEFVCEMFLKERGTVTYDAKVRSYKITFKNFDGTVLQEQEFEYGSVPVYGGSDPQKASDENYDYIFSGWSPALESVNGEKVYTAHFEKKALPSAYDAGNSETESIGF